MRIRKRPPQPPPPPPPPVEASVVDEARGGYSGRRREGEGVLHPQPQLQGGDLPIDPHGGWWGARPRPRRDPIHTRFLQDLPPPPPHQYPPADQIKTTSSPPLPDHHHQHVDDHQVVCIPDNHAGQIIKVAEIEKMVVDSDKTGGGQGQVQVNSKIKWSSGGSSSSSGAELSGGMMIMAAISGGEGEAKTRTRRTSATSFTYLGSSSAIDDTKSSEDDDYTGAREVNGRKRRSPAVLMEGSRCSRVNGRGWRCCQQTLVGYSLCEHHLGKGRLRSMSSVRGQLGGSKGKKKRATDTVDHGEEEDEDKSSVTKKRKKIGIVKARSISSLLGDTVSPAATMMAAAPPEAGEAMAAQPSASASST